MVVDIREKVDKSLDKMSHSWATRVIESTVTQKHRENGYLCSVGHKAIREGAIGNCPRTTSGYRLTG